MAGASDLLTRIEADLSGVDWQEVDDHQASGMLQTHGADAYGGPGEHWQFFVVGKPDGTVCMATAVRLHADRPQRPSDPHVVNLPPELAAKVYEEARESVLAEEYFTGFSARKPDNPTCAICQGSFRRGSTLIVLGRTRIAHQSCHEGAKVHAEKGRKQ